VVVSAGRQKSPTGGWRLIGGEIGSSKLEAAMLDKLTKAGVLFTAAGLYLVTFYNIGYFYVVGFQFAGFADLRNVFVPLASVSLLLITLLGLMVFAAEFRKRSLEGKTDLEKTKHWYWRVNAILLAVLFLMVGMSHVPGVEIPNQTARVVLGVIFLSAAMGFVYPAVERWMISGAMDWGRMIGSLLLVTALSMVAGLGVATVNSGDEAQSFEVKTKGKTYGEVKIMMTSSAGVVLSERGTMIFIPASEIASITRLSVQ
jgi:hypothetical protein